jgi:hypothetical protein
VFSRAAKPSVLLDVTDAERRQAIAAALTAVGYELSRHPDRGVVISDDPDASPDIQLVRRSRFACHRALSDIRPGRPGAIIPEDDIDGLVLAVIACHSGYHLIHDDVIEIAGALPPLASRARAIVEALMAGESVRTIAANFELTDAAIRHELADLGDAWQTRNGAELLAAAHELGLRPRPSDRPLPEGPTRYQL